MNQGLSHLAILSPRLWFHQVQRCGRLEEAGDLPATLAVDDGQAQGSAHVWRIETIPEPGSAGTNSAEIKDGPFVACC